MLQRGRKSLEAVRIVPGERPPAPVRLSDAAKGIWEDVISSLPADYFRAADQKMLSCYCEQLAVYEAAMDAWTNGDKDYDHWRSANEALKNWMGLATKLRLTPQSRYDTQKAAVAARRGAEKPWRRTGSE